LGATWPGRACVGGRHLNKRLPGSCFGAFNTLKLGVRAPDRDLDGEGCARILVALAPERSNLAAQPRVWVSRPLRLT
jgi:hypothetical protein